MTRRSSAGVGVGPPPLPPPPSDHRHLQRVRPGCESRSTSSGATYEGAEGGACGGGAGGAGLPTELASFAPEPPLPLPRRSMYVYQHTTVPLDGAACPGHSGSGRGTRRACSATSLSGASSCSARCEALSNFCYYFFQVVLSVGLLGGISLLIAVCVLRGQAWNRDLSSLPYIGFVLVVVCSGLLAVQINAHRSKHRRKLRLGGGLANAGRTDLIPLERIAAGTSNAAPTTAAAPAVAPHFGVHPHQPPSAPPFELMYQPLLPPGRTTLPRQFVDRQENVGPPWWRRNCSENDRVHVASGGGVNIVGRPRPR